MLNKLLTKILVVSLLLGITSYVDAQTGRIKKRKKNKTSEIQKPKPKPKPKVVSSCQPSFTLVFFGAFKTQVSAHINKKGPKIKAETL